MRKKKFDCVEMMHKGQEAVRKRLEGMTDEQKLEYWHKRTQEIRAEIEKSKSEQTTAGKR